MELQQFNAVGCVPDNLCTIFRIGVDKHNHYFHTSQLSSIVNCYHQMWFNLTFSSPTTHIPTVWEDISGYLGFWSQLSVLGYNTLPFIMCYTTLKSCYKKHPVSHKCIFQTWSLVQIFLCVNCDNCILKIPQSPKHHNK